MGSPARFSAGVLDGRPAAEHQALPAGPQLESICHCRRTGRPRGSSRAASPLAATSKHQDVAVDKLGKRRSKDWLVGGSGVLAMVIRRAEQRRWIG